MNLAALLASEWAQLALYAVAGFVLLNVMLGIVTFLVLMERKVSGWMQVRLGPMEIGPWGILVTVADAIKLMTKQDVVPRHVDRFVFRLAPALIALPPLIAVSLVPFGKNLIFADTSVALLLVLALTSLTSMAILMAGWGSNNKYSLLGGVRSAAQDLSYEVALIFAALGPVMLAGSLSLQDIVKAQGGVWFVFLQPLGFILFLIAGIAELNRTPFDIPEAESEIVAGYHTEYSGMRFALFFMAEYANMFLVSCIVATLFLGGWQGPVLPGVLWFVLKVFAVIFVIMWVRWTFPRFRVDQLMTFGWKVLVPLGLLNILLTGGGMLLV